MPQVLQLYTRDNVLIALTDLQHGETLEFNGPNYSRTFRPSTNL